MIRVLDKRVADKIAAGEVVERPFSVIKELIENSIDAGAARIVCEIKKGGKEYIRVTDDGSGIPSEEAITAFQRHATSKIEKASDLDAIVTLGFRGEALASIAAVSKVDMVTKTGEQKSARRLLLEGGEVILSEPAGAPDGTTIIVRDLFYNMPARYKFLKSDAAETAAVVDFISKVALAYPHINIRMISNGSILFSTNGKGSLLDNIMTVYGAGIGGQLLEISKTNADMKLHGFIGRPDQSRKNRKHQVFFVNGRSVSSVTVLNGLESGYKERLFDGYFPVAFLFLDMDPARLDVNIHPNKKQIKFDDDGAVKAFIKNAVEEVLNGDASIPHVPEKIASNPFSVPRTESWQLESRQSESRQAAKIDSYGDVDDFSSYGEMRVCEPSVEAEIDIHDVLAELRSETSEKEQREQTAMDLKPGGNFFSSMEVLGVIFATYIITRDETCLYLIDQHAAHERVYYEKFMAASRRETTIPKQQLLLPLVIEISVEAKLFFERDECAELLESLGFGLADFGAAALKLYELPAYMQQEEARIFLEEFFDNAESGGLRSDPARIERLIMRSCKAAVKANDKLSSEEIVHLLRELDACEKPHSCPHGRPTAVRFGKYDIEKLFKRV